MMGQQRKIRVGVIFGGRSGEHEVSLMSARSVMAALDPARYEVVPIGITKAGHWLAGNPMAVLTGESGESRAAALLPEPNDATLFVMDSGRSTGMSVMAELDVVFPVLHGTYGEDGTVQGLLELAGIPYVGSGVVGSAVGMDKAIFKQVMVANGLPILPWVMATRREWLQDPEQVIGRVEAALPYPVFTKPANLGSSVGISKCYDREGLIAGMNDAARYDRRLVIEQGINKARELEVSVMGNDEPIASVVGEVRPRRDFYDYVAKYTTPPGSDEESELIIPADIPAALSDDVRKLAVRAYRAIDAAGLGRVDMLMDNESGAFYVNEINTIPGFTSISMYPKLWEASGVSYAELLDRLIDLALDRRAEKDALETSFSAD